jgi:hypothetical protein
MTTLGLDPVLQFCLGLLALGLTVNYVVWSQVRVFFLRQEFYLIRDQLWDKAQLGGFLDDPEYRATRHQIHLLIRCARSLHVAIFEFDEAAEVGVLPRSLREDVRRECEAALAECAKVAVRYMLLYRASGLMYLTLRMSGGWATAIRRLTEQVSHSFATSFPRSLAIVTSAENRSIPA